MKTEDLIRGLSADARPTHSLESGLGLALAAGGAGALVLFALLLSLRAGMPGLLMEPRILLKFAVTLSLAGAAGWTALRLVRPGARPAGAARLLLLPAGFLALGVAAELVFTPATRWLPDLVGHYALACAILVPVMSAPVLAAALLALRRGAPDRPAVAGAAAGLLAGGIGATLYAFHCIDDSPLFLLAWYGLALTLTTATGALLGRVVLRW
ncbi:NrsF family protein [Aquabacter spiritensis]|uniref:DUF1109 family protein n=1 Tax=Aquabacter spiritensis TaxID=933073 RepID=A0A4R3M0D8_9HYPH|nr:DUF1109 domain-containing protein [Aquabacter spiritensis]TCT06524.1 hypothetical protein EDC64_1021 [Aquabacter spiritensis]